MRRGYRVFAGVRRAEDGEALVRDAEGATGRIDPLILDVSHADQIAAARDRVAGEVGAAGLAGLVNNAGVVVPGPVEFLPLEALRWQFEINTLGPVAMTQAFLDLLRQGRGRVVMISSIAGFLTTPFMAPYSASKAALEAYSDALRAEIAPWGVDVAIVEPGSIATPIWGKEPDMAQLGPEVMERYGARIAAFRKAVGRTARRGILPQRVADAVRHALEAQRPRTRYKVGPDALGATLLAALPDRLRDAVFARFLPV